MTIPPRLARAVSWKFFASIPSFRKGGLGRIWKKRQRKSPSIPLFQKGENRMLSTMSINGADVMDLSFLNQLEEERKRQKTVPICSTGSNSSKGFRRNHD